MEAEKQYPLKGVIYNVVRRPLSGGKDTIRQHKPSKSNPLGETKAQFYARLEGLIKEEARLALAEKRDCYYFMRWRIEVSQQDLTRFQTECLNPILERLCDWYGWVAGCYETGKNLWDNDVSLSYAWDEPEVCHSSSVHFRFPYGVWNPITDGSGETDIDEYMSTGYMTGLRKVDTLFRELA